MGLQVSDEAGELVSCHQPVFHQLRTVEFGEADQESVVVAAVDVGRANGPNAHLIEPGAAQQSR